jgi:hypothetical protein
MKKRLTIILMVLSAMCASLAFATNQSRKGPTRVTYYTDRDCQHTFTVYGYDVNEGSYNSCEAYPYLGTIEPGGSLTFTVRAGETLWLRFTSSGGGPCYTNAPSMDATIPGGEAANYSYELSCGSSW